MLINSKTEHKLCLKCVSVLPRFRIRYCLFTSSVYTHNRNLSVYSSHRLLLTCHCDNQAPWNKNCCYTNWIDRKTRFDGSFGMPEWCDAQMNTNKSVYYEQRIELKRIWQFASTFITSSFFLFKKKNRLKKASIIIKASPFVFLY